ncbi:MAG TPA: beta-galactosidase [Polyangiaceae bacterium]|nr:beta-galactosidase [Polyangiaceae bacterium]
MPEGISSAHAATNLTEAGALRARLTRQGLRLGQRVVPLLSGAVHYWRLEPRSWRDCLEALCAMGCTLVDVYVPWSVHEQSDLSFDFGQRNPALDVAAFLRLAEELGLYALVRPGPHINAELSGFGLPERVLWDPECQARSPSGAPVILPMPPLAFPVPSYASRQLLAHASAWLRRVAEELGPLAWPSGPIVMCQIDNEGALYFRDGVYEQDYHPDSLARYREALELKFGTPAALASAYGISTDNFEISPPIRFDAKDARELSYHLDWAEHQETLIADAFATFRRALSHAGLERVPTCHNLPMGEAATPLDPGRLGKVVECLGMDYYHVAAESTADAILRRTSEVTTRADAFEYPAFAIELAAGFPPFFPPLTEQDNRFAALSCLAAGIRGYSLYMAVERDRWIGAPIDRFGARRPSFDFWQRLSAAVQRTKLPELSRLADVCIVVPRSLHRLERLLHAFGPLSAAAFDVMGLSAYDSCFEQGPLPSALFEAEAWLRQLLLELNQRGVAYRVAGSDAATAALEQSRLGFVVAAAGLEPELWEPLREAAGRGKPLCFGPILPIRSPHGEPLQPLPDAAREAEAVTLADLSSKLDELCDRHRPFQLELAPGLRGALFSDVTHRPCVLFLTNTTATSQIAELAGSKLRSAVDALDGEAFHATVAALEVPLSPHSVRMLELT